MKKVVALILFVCMVLSMAGCAANTAPNETQASAGTNAPAETKEQVESVELNWWWFPLWKGMSGQADEQADVWPKAIAEQYMAEHPEVTKINIELLTWDNGIEKLDAAIAAGSPPDLCYLDLSWLPKYLKQGVVVTAEDYMNPGDKEDFYESAVEYVTYDGKMQAWPFLIAPRVLYANKTLLEEMGLADKLPLDGDRSWTIEEFNEIANAFPYEKDGKTIYAFEAATGASAVSYMMWMWNFGAELYNEDETEFLLNSPEGLAGAEYLMKMVNEGHFRYAPEGAQKANFWAGESAFVEQTAFTEEKVVNRVKNAMGEGAELPEIVAVQFPTAEGVEHAKTYSGIGGIVVFNQKNASEARIKAAAGLAEFITNTENSKAVKAGGTFPTRYSCGDVYGDDPNALVAQSMLPYGEDLGRQEDANKIYQNYIIPGFDSMFVGATTPAETLKKIADSANELLSK